MKRPKNIKGVALCGAWFTKNFAEMPNPSDPDFVSMGDTEVAAKFGISASCVSNLRNNLGSPRSGERVALALTLMKKQFDDKTKSATPNFPVIHPNERPQPKPAIPGWCKVGNYCIDPDHNTLLKILEVSLEHLSVRVKDMNSGLTYTVANPYTLKPAKFRCPPTEDLVKMIGKVLVHDEYINNARVHEMIYSASVWPDGSVVFNESFEASSIAERPDYTIDGLPFGIPYYDEDDAQ